MTRDEIIELMWQRNEQALFVSEDEFKRSFDEWQLVLFPADAEPQFAAFVKGPEFHFTRLQGKQPLTRRAIRVFLNHIIAHEGYAITRTPLEDMRQQHFNEAIGFREVGEDEFYVTYRIDETSQFLR